MLTIANQCTLLCLSRSAYYYKPDIQSDERDVLLLSAIIDELVIHPFYGYRKIAWALRDLEVTRKQIRRIIKRAGLRAIYSGKNLSKPKKGQGL